MKLLQKFFEGICRILVSRVLCIFCTFSLQYFSATKNCSVEGIMHYICTISLLYLSATKNFSVNLRVLCILFAPFPCCISVLCSDRVTQMTKTYNDIEAVNRLLEEVQFQHVNSILKTNIELRRSFPRNKKKRSHSVKSTNRPSTEGIVKTKKIW